MRMINRIRLALSVRDSVLFDQYILRFSGGIILG
jgi:hypothetical protein